MNGYAYAYQKFVPNFAHYYADMGIYIHLTTICFWEVRRKKTKNHMHSEIYDVISKFSNIIIFLVPRGGRYDQNGL